MSVTSVYFETVRGIVSGIAGAFNLASGNQWLKDRGIERSQGACIGLVTYGALGAVCGLMGGIILAPIVIVAAPLTVVFATVAGALAPAQLHAAYLAGQHDRQTKAQQFRKNS